MPIEGWSTKELIEYLSIFGDNRHIQALVIMAVSFLIAKIADWLITRVLLRVSSRTRTELDDRIIRILHWPIFASVLLAGFSIALAIEKPPSPFDFLGRGIIATLVILIWLGFGLRASVMLLGWMSNNPARFNLVQPSTRPLFEISAKIAIFALMIYFVMLAWEINPTGWLASAGILAVAVGLAAQETLGNLFAGISILADAPYRIGDYIVLEQGERGRVTKIGLRSTRILTRDDVEVTIPNSMIARSKIVNQSGGPWRRLRLKIPVGVAYGSDVDKVKEVLLQVAISDERVCDTPEPWIQFSGFGDSSLNFEIRCWVDDPSHGRLVDALNTAAYKALAQAGIEIPFPKRDVYIKEIPQAWLEKLREQNQKENGGEKP